ncbi:MAG: CotH kinase family protein, partial [Fidelibacterota bacterium]
MHGPHAYYDTNLHVMLNSNYSKKSEREVYVEIFDSSGNRIVNQDAGIRIFGGMTIYYPEKSLRLIARKNYGESRFKANIFNQGKKKYKQFILRHSGNDYRKTRFKDVLSTTLAAQSGLDVQAFVPSHLFVNSEYWGVYNIREKLNEYYIDNNYDCGTVGVDLLQAFKKVEEGTVDKYEELLNFIDNNKMKVDENYNHLSTLMDTRNFTNYWIYQMYFGNTDARGNIRFWRS